MSDVAISLETPAPTSLSAIDSRGVCNRLLDLAGDRPVTNTALQKLLYFAHGLYLVRTGLPLVYGYFEAWQSGPVHASAFASFKPAGKQPIRFRALRRMPNSGFPASIPMITAPQIDECLESVMSTYGALPDDALISLSMAPNAPWASTINKARTETVLDMEISDTLIREKFRYHKIMVGTAFSEGSFPVDAPLA